MLSPSQKQRISVARAVYYGADVYMFDDPLAPLSPAEASHVFSSCFLEHLAGSTRILVTHKRDVLERVDYIVCMTDEGDVLCCGSYADISSKHPEVFLSLIKKRRSLSDVLCGCNGQELCVCGCFIRRARGLSGPILPVDCTLGASQPLRPRRSSGMELFHYRCFGLLVALSAVLMMLRDDALYVAEVRAAGSLHARTLRSLLRLWPRRQFFH